MDEIVNYFHGCEQVSCKRKRACPSSKHLPWRFVFEFSKFPGFQGCIPCWMALQHRSDRVPATQQLVAERTKLHDLLHELRCYTAKWRVKHLQLWVVFISFGGWNDTDNDNDDYFDLILIIRMKDKWQRLWTHFCMLKRLHHWFFDPVDCSTLLSKAPSILLLSFLNALAPLGVSLAHLNLRVLPMDLLQEKWTLNVHAAVDGGRICSITAFPTDPWRCRFSGFCPLVCEPCEL